MLVNSCKLSQNFLIS